MTTDVGTLHAVGDRMMLRFERRFDHSIDRVWRMVTHPDGLARWFPARTEALGAALAGREGPDEQRGSELQATYARELRLRE